MYVLSVPMNNARPKGGFYGVNIGGYTTLDGAKKGADEFIKDFGMNRPFVIQQFVRGKEKSRWFYDGSTMESES